MKKAAIFVHCYPPAKGGLEYLIGEVKEILSEKFEVHVFTGRGLSLDCYKTFSNFTDLQSKTIHRLELNFFFQRLTNKFLNKIIFKIPFFSPWYFGPILNYEKKDIDLIKKSDFLIGTGLPTKSVYDAYRFARQFKKKLIVIPAYHNKNYYNNSFFFKKAFDYSSRIICLSEKERDDLVLNYKINKQKCQIVHFSPYSKLEISSNWAEIDPQLKEKTSQKKKVIGYVGQISTRKRLSFFRDLYEQYATLWEKRGLEPSFLLAGARTNKSLVVEKELLDLVNKKILTIKYNFNSKNQIYNAIDIFFNPSLEESLGIVNFEAIFYGIPLIIPKDSPFAQSVKDNQVGCLFSKLSEVGKTIIDLSTNDALYSQVVRAQYQIFEQYNLDNFKKELLAEL